MQRRKFLYLAGVQFAGAAAGAIPAPGNKEQPSRKVVLVGFGGGTRYAESFGPQGQANIPLLRNELFPLGTFYSRVYNDAETTHYPSTAAVLTGRWQNIAQYGGERPTHPTIFEYFRKQLGRPAEDAWLVAQGKGFLTAGHSMERNYGPAYGGHVLAPRQMLIGTFRQLLREDEETVFRDRKKLIRELERSLRATYGGPEAADTGFERLPEVPAADPSGNAAPRPSELPAPAPVQRRFVAETERFLAETVARFLAESDNPRSGDALNCFVAREIMTRFAPSLLVVNFGEIDVAHQGSFSLYLKAIRNADKQVLALWRHIQEIPAYREKTTLVVLPDHGRNLDGLGMNGFQHHRGGDDG
jgi:hypothetical protein